MLRLLLTNALKSLHFCSSSIYWWLPATTGNLCLCKGKLSLGQRFLSPVNKAESVPCSFIGSVCCQHVLPSSHGFPGTQALVIARIMGMLFIPEGVLMLRHTKEAPPNPPFLSVTAFHLMIVFAEKDQLLNYHQNCPWEKKVKTYCFYYCQTANNPITTHCSMWLKIYFLGLRVCKVSKLLSRTTQWINKCP